MQKDNSWKTSETEKNGKELTKEILYKGYYYDVTSFIRRHPGGSVIQFYTEAGEDATQAIEQFHFRAKNKVDLIMKSLKRRPATKEDAIVDQNGNLMSSTRHNAMSQDFKELFEQLQNEGYFEPSYRQVILRFLECISVYALTLGLLLYQPQPFYTKILAAMVAGFGISRFGWVEHEGGHRSLTGNPKVDQLLQSIAMSLFGGMSSVWYNSVHNRHHAMPQRVHRDVDLASLPVVTFSAKAVTKRSEFIGFLMKYQGFTYWTLDLFLISFAWKFYLHPMAQLRKKAYFEMVLNIPSYIVMFQVGVGWYFVMMYFMAVIMALNFALGHSHLEVTEEPRHWIEYAFTHTANIRGSMLTDWWMGYLNYQIEHHLFPTMPQFREKEICERVKALAEKHGLPYIVHEYSDACRLAVKNLHAVGKELSERDWGEVKKEQVN